MAPLQESERSGCAAIVHYPDHLDREDEQIVDIGYDESRNNRIPRENFRPMERASIGPCESMATESNNSEQLEQRLRDSPEMLAGIIESAMDAIIAVDDAQRIVLFNAAAERIFACPANEAVGSSVERFIPERFRAGHSTRVRRFGESDITSRTLHGLGTLWGLRATGEEFPIEASISKVEYSGKKFFTVIIRDVSERKLAEEARFRLAAIVESSEDAIVSGTLDGIIVSWNAGAQSIYGYTEAEAIGKPIGILLPPELEEEENKILETLKAGGRIEHFETVRVTKTGKRINVSLTISPIKDSSGRTVGISGIARDITERKLAEESMREMNHALETKNALLQSREELLRVFVQNVPAAVAMLDRDMRYLQVSDRWCSDNSVKASELLGRLREELPEMPERWKEVNRRALRGETLRADEDRWESGGSTRWARWEVHPWRNSDGTVGGILVFAEDITHRKQMEEELSGMSRKLIESQEQERSRIGRELHDDINQQLALLAIDIEQLRRQTPGSKAEIGSGLTEIRDRVTAISADVQSLSHQLHSPQLEILGIVAAMRGFCRVFAAHQKVTVDFTHDNIPNGVSQEVSLCLFRVLQEALHNAVKHSNVRHYTVRLDCAASELHLTVSDCGTGFDAEAAMGKGGLGLVSMRERVRLVNGTIAIKSTPMGGTIVDVNVPLILEHHRRQTAS
jgi:PAS domain S-box-containing protein